MDLPLTTLNVLSTGFTIFVTCLGIRIIRAPELRLKIADNQLTVSNSVTRLEELTRRLEDQAVLIKEKDLAYEYLLETYEELRPRCIEDKEFSKAVRAIDRLPRVENIEELQTEIRETGESLTEVKEE